MSADANSAFGDQVRPSRAKRGRQDSRDAQGFLQQLHDSSEGHNIPALQRDNAHLGASLSPTANAQAAPLHHTDWFEGRAGSQTAVDTLAQKLQKLINKVFSDQVTPVRLASHLSVLAVAALILFLSRVDMPNWNISLRLFPNSTLLDNGTLSDGTKSPAVSMISPHTAAIVASNESIQRAIVPFTIIHEAPKKTIQAYTVQPGDTVLGIAEKFGLQPETIQWANPNLELNPDLIRPGDQLNILPVNGVLHTVTRGDTLTSLASRFKVSVDDIVNYKDNGLSDATASLVVGSKLVIPGGTKPFAMQQVVAYSGSGAAPTSAKLGSGIFGWPVSGSITQRYWSGHRAIDIGAWIGSPVKSADSGYVAVAATGWNTGYGNFVIVDHGNGFSTLYAHLSSIYVRKGENIARGQQIGAVGTTGNSTGPHLHFEIRYHGVQRNPLSYLP